jgi:diguanylate cyclase (GGDEF)-like protein/PAS domain S-box-containing protein
MKIKKNNDKGKQYWYELLPWLFLVLTLPVIYVIWHGERLSEFNAKKNEFESELEKNASQLTQQMVLFDQSLHAIRSFFDASEFVSADEFSDFVTDILNSKFSLGVQQIGFIKLINVDQPETYRFADAKLKKFLSYTERATQPLHAPVLYIISNPKIATNETVYDAFTNSALKKDMEFTALHNTTLISAAIELGPLKQNNCICWSMILPVYKNVDIRNRLSNDKNKRDVYGWIFFNLNLKTLFQSILTTDNDPEIRYTLSQDRQTQQAKILYQTNLNNATENNVWSSFSAQKSIRIHGQAWLLSAQSLAPFEKKLNYQDSNRIGALGLIISLTLTGILFLVIARVRVLDELKRANQQLKLSDDRWQFALEGAGDGVWDWDIQSGNVIYSRKWKQMLGFSDNEIDNNFMEWQNRVHPDDYPNIKQALKATLNNTKSNYSVECRLKCKDESWKWILSRGMVVSRDKNGTALRIVGTHTDISQLKQSEEAIWQHANFDSLTGLPNRRMLYAKLEEEMKKCVRSKNKLALLFLDLDRFKEINDSLGHDQGDILLNKTAKRLRECLYAQDIVARLGGDEFLILITDIRDETLKNIEIVAQRVLNSLTEAFQLTHEKAFVSASIGIAIYPDDSESIDNLIRNVDQAMYASKKRGGNCFTYFTQKMQENALNRLKLSTDLRAALPQNQLFLVYQPIVELQTGKIFKAEVLLRWQHPERGLVPPSEFIPIAEDTRLINEIGNWVFKVAIQQCLDWRKRINHNFQVAVNKSAIQFMQTDSKNQHWTESLLNQPGNADAIVIEITESLLLEVSQQVKDWLEYYNKNGIQVSLDDFGTGYSSLSYLRKFDIDYIKIDQSFVYDLEVNHENSVLCQAIITMAHSLGIKVIAEGIETECQKDMIKNMGCDFGQGYYFSRPLLAEDFEAFLINHNKNSGV